MSDGRIFTDYRPRCENNLSGLMRPGEGSYVYRQRLIETADDIRGAQRSAALNRAYCGPCMAPYDIGTMLPEAQRMVCNRSSCAMVRGAPGGLGTGREYGLPPDVRAAQERFLAQQKALQERLARRANCCAPGGRDMPPAGVHPALQGTRWAVPGGGAPLGGGDATVR
jgi:hypothetical protein